MPANRLCFLLRSPSSIAEDEERGGQGGADDVEQAGVVNEIGVSHQRDADRHGFPLGHAFAVDEGDKTNAAENESGDQVGHGEHGH